MAKENLKSVDSFPGSVPEQAYKEALRVLQNYDSYSSKLKLKFEVTVFCFHVILRLRKDNKIIRRRNFGKLRKILDVLFYFFDKIFYLWLHVDACKITLATANSGDGVILLAFRARVLTLSPPPPISPRAQL